MSLGESKERGMHFHLAVDNCLRSQLALYNQRLPNFSYQRNLVETSHQLVINQPTELYISYSSEWLLKGELLTARPFFCPFPTSSKIVLFWGVLYIKSYVKKLFQESALSNR